MRTVRDDPLADLEPLLDEDEVPDEVTARNRAPLSLSPVVQHPDVRALRVLQDSRRRNRRTHHARLRGYRHHHRAADLKELLRILELRIDLHRVRRLVRGVLHVLRHAARHLRLAVRQRQVDDRVLAARGPLGAEELEELAVGHREADADRILLDERDQGLRALVDVVALRLLRRAQLARDRRHDRAVLKVILCRHELRLRRGKCRARTVALRQRVVDGVKRHGARLQQLLVPLVGELRVLDIRLHLRQLRLGVLHRRLILHGIDPVERVASLDLRAVLKADLADLARDLRHDVHLLDGDDLPGIDLLPEVRPFRHLGDRQRQFRRSKENRQCAHFTSPPSQSSS